MKFLLLLAFIALARAAQDWKLDAGKSQIGFAIRQITCRRRVGSALHCQGRLRPRPAGEWPLPGRGRPQQHRHRFGRRRQRGQAPAWFDAARHPRQLRFEERAQGGERRLHCLGDMTIKGQTRPFTAPFSLLRQPAAGSWRRGGFR